MPQSLLEMTADLVLAQMQAHSLSPEEMQTALRHTYAQLVALQAQEGSHGLVPVVTPQTLPGPIHWKKSITKHTVTCLACGASFKQLSVRHLQVHGLDGQSYRVKYGIPRTQALSAKETTSRRRDIVQRSRPWEKAPTYLKAHEKVEQAVAQKKGRAQRKGTARAKK